MDLRGQLLQNPGIEVRENLFYQKGFQRTQFESSYITLREKEHRLYKDDEVAQLPHVSPEHPLSKEWKIREHSLRQLIGLMANYPNGKKLLDLGCGNGWLARRLAELGMEVLGLDKNETELRQASRLFRENNLSFVCGDVFHASLDGFQFDTILLASCIQYFPDIAALVSRLLNLVKYSGNILIIDSPLYQSAGEAMEARMRSSKYFSAMGNPEMTEEYFHHTINALKPFSYTLLHEPASMMARVKRIIFKENFSPFPAIQIRRN